jgi:hypothetical protein
MQPLTAPASALVPFSKRMVFQEGHTAPERRPIRELFACADRAYFGTGWEPDSRNAAPALFDQGVRRKVAVTALTVRAARCPDRGTNVVGYVAK